MGLEKRHFNRRDVIKGVAAAVAVSAVSGIVENMSETVPTSGIEKEKTAFERRYVTSEVIGGEETLVVDALPEVETGGPILVAPGWGTTIHTNAGMMELFHSQGHRVLSVDHPRHGDDMTHLTQQDEQRAHDFPKAELRKAANLIETLDTHELKEQVDCFAFSEGALNTMLAAYMHPEKFRTIILAEPAGLIGDDNLISLALRFRSQGKSDANGVPSLTPLTLDDGERARQIQQVKETWEQESNEYIGANKMRTAAELWAIATMKIDDLIAAVREAGVKVIVVSAVDDQVFPTKTMAERLKKDSVDGFISIQGAHGPQYSAHVADSIFKSAAEHRD